MRRRHVVAAATVTALGFAAAHHGQPTVPVKHAAIAKPRKHLSVRDLQIRVSPRPVAASRSETRPAPAPTIEPVVGDGSVWDRLAICESSGHWNYGAPGAYTDGDGYEGGLNFAPSTWDSFAPDGYPAHAYDASREQQIVVAEHVLAVQGWGAWPACSSQLGLR